MPVSNWFLGNDPSGAVAWTDTVVERGITFNYLVKGSVGRTYNASYAVRNIQERVTSYSYAINNNVARSQSFNFQLLGSPSRAYVSTYAVRGQVTNFLSGQYEILIHSGGGSGNNAPTGLSVTSVAATSSAVISWVSDIDKDTFKIYSAPAVGGPFTLVHTENGDQRSYTYPGLQPSRPLYFTVSAVLSGQESAKIVPPLIAVIPPAIDPVDTDDVVEDWPFIVEGDSGPNQPISVQIGGVTKTTTANSQGRYAVSFLETDNLSNGPYTVYVTSTYITNQNITQTRQITLDTTVTPPPVNQDTTQFFLFMTF